LAAVCRAISARLKPIWLISGRARERASEQDKEFATENSTVRKIPTNHLATITAFTDPNRKISVCCAWNGDLWPEFLVGSVPGKKGGFSFVSQWL